MAVFLDAFFKGLCIPLIAPVENSYAISSTLMVIMHILPPLSFMSLLAGDSIGDSVSFQNQHLRVYWEEHTTLLLIFR